ncbi:hypothetical protein LINGRAHAP2_LOCUS20168 [Linum grandiflorum]
MSRIRRRRRRPPAVVPSPGVSLTAAPAVETTRRRLSFSPSHGLTAAATTCHRQSPPLSLAAAAASRSYHASSLGSGGDERCLFGRGFRAFFDGRWYIVASPRMAEWLGGGAVAVLVWRFTWKSAYGLEVKLIWGGR